MRVSAKDKDRSRQRIVASAARLMRERGVEGASVGEIMRGAGLTLGGFYRHFDSKEALVSAAVQAAFNQILAGMETTLELDDTAGVIAKFQTYYLSEAHVANPGDGCPVAALAGELGRGPATSTASMTIGVQRMIDLLASGMTGSPRTRRRDAARRLAMMAGAVMIARTTDPATAQLILESTRDELTPTSQESAS